MKGNVIGFDPDTNTGAISGHDGKRYDFATLDWHGHGTPHHGDVVDFTPDGDRAAQIYLLDPEYVAPSFGQFYFSAKGRISRSQYWLKYFLPVFVIGVVLNIVGAIADVLKFLPSLFQLAVLWPGIAVLVKRIHDRNKSGWLVWVLYGPLILAIVFAIGLAIAIATGSTGGIATMGTTVAIFGFAAVVVAIWFFVEFGCMRGTVGANAYGADPVQQR